MEKTNNPSLSGKEVYTHRHRPVDRVNSQDRPEMLQSANGNSDDFQAQDQNQDAPIDKFNKKLFILGMAFFVFILFFSGGIYYLYTNLKTEPDQIQNPNSNDQSAKQTEASPEAAIKPPNKSDWQIEVLNGSGVAGSAKKAADKLQDLGYTIIKTGNADKNDYKLSELLISKEFMDKKDFILQDLKDSFNISSVSGELTDSTASARLIIGQN